MEGYDPSSGQVYRETIVKATSEQPLPWDERYPSKTYKPMLPIVGVDSLYETVMRKILSNANAIQEESLVGIPAPILESIWRAIRRQHRESLHVFKAFANSCCGDRKYIHSTTVPFDGGPLVDKFAMLNSVNCYWLTDVKITNTHFSPGSLRQLAVISNLQNLMIGYPASSNEKGAFNDAILNNLSWQASSVGAFRRLEMIFLEFVPGITSKAFECLSKFPALDTFCVCRTGIKGKDKGIARQMGWKTSPENSSLSSMVKECRLKTTYANSPLYFHSLADNYINRRRSQTSSAACDVPVMNAIFHGDRSRGPVTRKMDYEELFCFERNWGIFPLQPTDESTVNSNAPTTTSQESYPANKKRKLKSGRAVDLETMLAAYDST